MKQKPFDLKKYITENKIQTGMHKSKLSEGITLSNDEKKDIQRIIDKDIAPFMQMLADTNGVDYFNAVKKEFISVVNKIKP